MNNIIPKEEYEINNINIYTLFDNNKTDSIPIKIGEVLYPDHKYKMCFDISISAKEKNKLMNLPHDENCRIGKFLLRLKLIINDKNIKADKKYFFINSDQLNPRVRPLSVPDVRSPESKQKDKESNFITTHTLTFSVKSKARLSDIDDFNYNLYLVPNV